MDSLRLHDCLFHIDEAMTRYIVCESCSQETFYFRFDNDLMPTVDTYTATRERTRITRGHLLQNVRCDICNRSLKEADKAAAISIYKVEGHHDLPSIMAGAWGGQYLDI